MAQKVKTTQANGQEKYHGNDGIAVPAWHVADDLLEIRKNGLDLACLNRRRHSL